MVSNYEKSVAMKVIAVNPEKEVIVSPALTDRINGLDDFSKFNRGEIIISEIIAKSMDLKKGDEIVLIGTNAADQLMELILNCRNY